MATSRRRTLAVTGSASGLKRAAQALEAFSAEHGLTHDQAWPLQVALDEVLSNVVRHAYRERPGEPIELEYGFEAGELRIEVRDRAAPFDPLRAPEPDLGRPLTEREPGGLGIALVKQLMDAVEYERVGEGNRLVLKKKIGP